MGIESNATVWEPGQTTVAGASAKTRSGCASQALAAQCRSSAHFGKAVGPAACHLRPGRTLPGAKAVNGSCDPVLPLCACVLPIAITSSTEPHPEEWLLIEWPKKESEPTKYWLSTMPAKTSLKSLVKMAKHRWIIERDYEELKQELGLGHYEGRGWRGFHHHATLVHRSLWVPGEPSGTVFPPPPASAILDYQPPSRRRTSARVVRRVRPERHNPCSIATLRIVIARQLLQQLPHCPFCGSPPG